MMDFTDYYVNQAGNGLSGFEGVRFQRGHGFFGRFFKSSIIPMLKFLGKRALSSGADIASDVLEGIPIKEAAKARGVEAMKGVTSAGINRARQFVQSGKGRKRRRRVVKTVKRKRRSYKTRRKRRSTKRIPDIF
jgi:hypothetical protein